MTPLKRDELLKKRCTMTTSGSPPMDLGAVTLLIGELKGWMHRDGREIVRTFTFKDYSQTMAFANAVAWIAIGENHHPDMEIAYNKCTIRFSTHDVGGLSENDFIAAAKVDALMMTE